jgi:methyl-accepting chemotaxis protein
MLIAGISCLAIVNLSQANDQIKGLIQNSLEKVEKGSELVNRSGATLQGIVATVKRVTEIVGEIAVASSKQSAGIEQVNTAVTQMDHLPPDPSARAFEEIADQIRGIIQPRIDGRILPGE